MRPSIRYIAVLVCAVSFSFGCSKRNSGSTETGDSSTVTLEFAGFAYFAENTINLEGLNITLLLRHEKMKKTLEDEFEKSTRGPFERLSAPKYAGLSVEDVRYVLWGGVPNDHITVHRLAKPADLAWLDKATRSSVGGKSYWQVRVNGSIRAYISFPNETTMLATDREATLQEILGRSDQQIVVEPRIREAVYKVFDGDVWSANRRPILSKLDEIKSVTDPRHMEQRVKTVAKKYNLSASTLEETFLFWCASAEEAKALIGYYETKMAEHQAEPKPDFTPPQREAWKKRLQGVKVRSIGVWLEITTKLDLTSFDQVNVWSLLY